MNTTVNAFSAGTLGPLYYGLSLRVRTAQLARDAVPLTATSRPQNSALIIVFCNIFSCAVPAYLAIFGPRTGMRMMTNARYSCVSSVHEHFKAGDADDGRARADKATLESCFPHSST